MNEAIKILLVLAIGITISAYMYYAEKNLPDKELVKAARQLEILQGK